jgi:ATP-dependent RNA helicase RhlE
MSFKELGLSAELLRAVEAQSYDQPTAIQQQAIPPIITGSDILASAQTGTGKTAGFMLPLLHRWQASTGATRNPQPYALILTPTRELAAQVAESAEQYGRHLPARTMTIYGGVSMRPQVAALRRGVEIVVATPGRLLDHMQQRTIDLSRIQTVILDEADRMLDMGFIRDIRRILSALPKRRQTLLFSATFSKEIRTLASEFLDNPVEVAATPRNTAAERVEQIVYPVDKERKRELLSHRIGTENWQQVLVFTRTKHGADRLARQLNQDGVQATAIHGRKTQNARTRALADFKAGKVRVLVATDVAARGLDIERLPHVVNFELPEVPEDYVHRIGRTARAGEDGQAISLVCIDENKHLRAIEKLLNTTLHREVIPGYEVDPRIQASPPPAPHGGQNRSRNSTPRRRQTGRQGGIKGRSGSKRTGGSSR